MVAKNECLTKWGGLPPVDEFPNRLEKIRKTMKENGFDAFFAFSDEYRYANVRYLSDFRPCTLNALGGLYTPAMVLIANNEDPVIFVPDNEVPFCESFSFIKDIRPWRGELISSLKKLKSKPSIKNVGIEGLEIMPYLVYKEIEQYLVGVTLKPSKLLAEIRGIKSPWEIDMMENAAELSDLAMSVGVEAIEEGMTEWEISAVIDSYYKFEGCSMTVPNLIGIGSNSAEGGSEISKPSWEPRGNRRLRRGDCINIDLAGAVPQGYCSDLCRGMGFKEMPKEYYKIVPIVIKAIDRAISVCKVGNKAGDIERASHSSVEDAGYGKYFKHEAFHGIGLEVEEVPFLHEDVLKENMCISVESGIYLPDKMGIRLEDVVAVTKSGPRVLNRAPREIFIT